MHEGLTQPLPETQQPPSKMDQAFAWLKNVQQGFEARRKARRAAQKEATQTATIPEAEQREPNSFDKAWQYLQGVLQKRNNPVTPRSGGQESAPPSRPAAEKTNPSEAAYQQVLAQTAQELVGFWNRIKTEPNRFQPTTPLNEVGPNEDFQAWLAQPHSSLVNVMLKVFHDKPSSVEGYFKNNQISSPTELAYFRMQLKPDGEGQQQIDRIVLQGKDALPQSLPGKVKKVELTDQYLEFHYEPTDIGAGFSVEAIATADLTQAGPEKLLSSKVKLTISHVNNPLATQELTINQGAPKTNVIFDGRTITFTPTTLDNGLVAIGAQLNFRENEKRDAVMIYLPIADLANIQAKVEQVAKMVTS